MDDLFFFFFLNNVCNISFFWKRMSAELSFVSSWRPYRSKDWTELNWTTMFWASMILCCWCCSQGKTWSLQQHLLWECYVLFQGYFWRWYMWRHHSFTSLEDVPLMEFIYLVFSHMPGGVTVGDSGLCCCVPCLFLAPDVIPCGWLGLKHQLTN